MSSLDKNVFKIRTVALAGLVKSIKNFQEACRENVPPNLFYQFEIVHNTKNTAHFSKNQVGHNYNRRSCTPLLHTKTVVAR